MSPRFVPLDRFLLAQLIADERDPLTSEMAATREFADQCMIASSYGDAYALIDGPHAVVAAGMTLRWGGRAEAWCLISRFARRRHLIAAVGRARAHMDRRQRHPSYRRIEMTVRDSRDFSPQSFARALGFVQEGYMRSWDPAGRNHILVARVQ